MRNILVAAFAIWCATLPARADATLTMRVQAGALDTSVSILLTDAEGTRAVQYARRSYPTIVENGTPRPTTNREAIEALMRDLLRSIPQNIVSGERRDAARTAEDGVSPINPR
jgi:hypothetical protein